MKAEQYPVYKLSKNQANRAGKVLVTPASIEEKIDAFEIMEQWCVLHAYPLDFYNERIRDLIQTIGKTESFITARRIKRIPSIYHKLVRFPEMSFGRMQDIGGIRIIVPKADDIDFMREKIVQAENIQKFKRICDYVAQPKRSGYRSCHLIYEFNDSESPREYYGLNIEVQIRSKIQHAWATALETFSVFLGHPLKSSQGPQDFLTFFELASAAFSYYENRPLMEKYASADIADLVRKLYELSLQLKIRENLDAFSDTITVSYSNNDNFIGSEENGANTNKKNGASSDSENKLGPVELNLTSGSCDAGNPKKERKPLAGDPIVSLSPSVSKNVFVKSKGNYIILKLSPKTGKVMIHLCQDIAEAHQLYVDLEQFKGPSDDIVLVSVSSVSALREAYPNYFANTVGFLYILDELFETYCKK